MDASFVVVDAVSITKPAVMAVAVHNPEKILKTSVDCPRAARQAAAREKNWAESMQSGSIHAMVALNERAAAL
jgi:hypothetical protein